MEPENIEWDNIDSIFIQDDTYEDFDAPKWVDLSASDGPVDDEAWFRNHDCKHPKTAQDFRKQTSNSKVKLLRFVTISEILPFRDRNRRENSSVTESSYTKAEKSTRPTCSKNVHENSENKNPNFSDPVSDGRTNNSPKKPMMKPKRDNSKIFGFDGSREKNPVKSDQKAQLRNTFSAHNLLGGREILNQIREFCSELKRLAKKGTKKGTSDKVLEKPKETMLERERMPLLMVKELETLNNGIARNTRNGEEKGRF